MKFPIVLLFFVLCSPRIFSQHASVSISNEFNIKENGFKDLPEKRGRDLMLTRLFLPIGVFWT
jgi:hypothetical protein